MSETFERLGAYRVESSLGRGGMGEVFLAWDERLDRHVAIKRILADPAPGQRARARFRREAKAAAGLSHPAIVQVFDLLETDAGDCLVMEYVEGRSLAEWIASGDLDLETVLRLGAEIAEGLSEAHACGLVHRDLKPENVQVTRGGHAKILDFGLAGLLWHDDAGTDSRAATLAETAALDEATLTRPGALLGTVHAMSPEQAGGRPVDHRSDLFALGGLLYEMLAGRAPFRGDNVLDSLRRVTSEDPAPLGEQRPDLPPALIELIDALLAKEPSRRPQNARVVADLLDRLRAGSASHPVALGSAGVPAPDATAQTDAGDLPTGEWPAPPRRRPGVYAAWALAVIVVIGIAAALLWRARPEPLPEPVSGKPSLAVLRFGNLSGDPELAWLSHGIAEMLITDLAQSPELEVLPLDALGDAGSSADSARPPEGVDIVLEGSFARSGDVLRIMFKVRRSPTGEILLSDHREGVENELFDLVDDVSRGVQRRLEVPRHAEQAESVVEVTTSSTEAWRYFTEGMELHRSSKHREALPLLERAVAVDPDFALALANLSVVHSNLGQTSAAYDAGRRAIERADRLPIQQRYFVEGWFYGSRWSTYDRAIVAYRQALAVYPDDWTYRYNLGTLYNYLERYDEAIREYRAIIEQGDDFAPTYYFLASAYAATGDFERGGELLEDYVRGHRDRWDGHLGLAFHLTDWGRLESARRAIERAEALRPGDLAIHEARWRYLIRRRSWPEALNEADVMSASTDAPGRWRGLVSAARTSLYRGRGEAALARLEASAESYAEPDAYAALSRCWIARLLLETGRPARALEAATSAQSTAPGTWPELEGMFLAALAHQALGRPNEADRLAAELASRAATRPNAVEQRQIHHLAARLALARGDSAKANRELSEALTLLPANGLPIRPYALPDHVPLWYALGEAELAEGRERQAIDAFRRVADSGVEHVEHPVLYVRSLFRLGELYREVGEEKAAREAFQRFLELWRDGDLDRSEVAVADAYLWPVD